MISADNASLPKSTDSSWLIKRVYSIPYVNRWSSYRFCVYIIRYGHFQEPHKAYRLPRRIPGKYIAIIEKWQTIFLTYSCWNSLSMVNYIDIRPIGLHSFTRAWLKMINSLASVTHQNLTNRLSYYTVMVLRVAKSKLTLRSTWWHHESQCSPDARLLYWGSRKSPMVNVYFNTLATKWRWDGRLARICFRPVHLFIFNLSLEVALELAQTHSNSPISPYICEAIVNQWHWCRRLDETHHCL